MLDSVILGFQKFVSARIAMNNQISLETVKSGEFCETTPCSSNPCLYGGTCDVVPAESGNPATFKCTCHPGYSGKTCEINPCLPDPCQNEGDCKGFYDNIDTQNAKKINWSML